jgi:LysM repeat protein
MKFCSFKLVIVMRKLMFIVFLVCAFANAQSQNLSVEGTAPDLYVNHIVAPKENFYSVGRLYNQAPKSIASFNNITLEKGLTIGQHIKIPLNAQNFDVSGNAETGETLIPVTHLVAAAETLTKIGTNYNVTPQLVKKWNGLSSDNIAPGSPLIVGHLKVRSDQAQGNNSTGTPNTSPTQTPTVSGQQDIASETQQPIAQPKKEDAIAGTAPATAANSETSAKKNSAPASVKEQAPAIGAGSQPARNNESRKAEVSTIETGSLAGGAFSAMFSNPSQKSLKNISGEAATFKSTSGWQDKKYYVLMDNVDAGTIVKVSAGDNKVIYAKVLGSMPEMKENNGLLLRISNAAASSLGIIDPKFPVEVSFYQ